MKILNQIDLLVNVQIFFRIFLLSYRKDLFDFLELIWSVELVSHDILDRWGSVSIDSMVFFQLLGSMEPIDF